MDRLGGRNGNCAELRARIKPHLDGHELEALVTALVSHPSELPNEGPVARDLAARMRRMGCFDEVVEQHVLAGRCNVIATVKGTSDGPHVLLNGHLDTPMLLDGWTRDPYDGAVEDGRLYGLGVTDMKGAVGAMVAAAAAVARSGIELPGDLTVSAVIHHDTVGLGTKFLLDAWDASFDAAINGEPTDLAVQLAHGGAWQFELETRGHAAHNTRQEEGVDAIRSMLLLLNELSAEHVTYDPTRTLPGLPRLVVGLLSGGVSPSRTAARCTACGDVRFPEGVTHESLTRDFNALIAKLQGAHPELSASYRCTAYQRPFRARAISPIRDALVASHREISGVDVRQTDGLPMSAAVTDASDLERRGIDTVIYGPGDWRVDPDESIPVADLLTAAEVYALATVSYMYEAQPRGGQEASEVSPM